MSASNVSRVGVIALLALFCGCSRAASAQPTLGRTSVHPRGVDGEYIERTVEVSVDAEGRVRWREARQWELLTDYALDYHADPEIYFDGARQSLDVAVARSTRPDGDVTETPENGFNELLPAELVDAPAYASIRRTLVSIVGLEPGSRAELDYTLADRTPTEWAPGGSITVAGPMPAKAIHLRLSSARGTLRSACVRCENTPRAGEAGSHGYDFTDMPQLDTYELGHHVGDGVLPRSLVPRVVFSTAESWSAEAGALARRVDAAATLTDGIRARATALCRDALDEPGRIEAIQAFVATGVDTVRMELPRLGYAPAAADATLSRSYGSALDKAVLLVALLRAAEVEAEVVLMSQDSEIATDVPWLGQLDRAWVVARAGGRELWLPPCRPLVLSREAVPGETYVLFLSRPGDPERLDAAAPSASTALLVADLRLGADRALTGDLALSASGRANPYFGLRAGERGAEGLLGATAGALGGEPGEVTVARFGALGTEVRSSLSATLDAEGGGDVLSVALPWPSIDPMGHVEPRDRRETPLELDGPALRSARITLALPSGWQPEGLPASVEVRNDAGWLTQSVTVTGRRVEIVREVAIRHRIVEPDLYDGARQLLEGAEELGAQVLILTAGEADDE